MPDLVAPAFDFEPAARSVSAERAPDVAAALHDPLELAKALMRCPSVTPRDADALGVLMRALGGLGFKCHELHFRGADGTQIRNLYARLGEGRPRVCFAGHTDVVPAGQGWSFAPFTPVLRDRVLYGRGACDMKGAIACFVAAVARFLAAHPHGFFGSISMLIAGDEEGDATAGTEPMLAWLAEQNEIPEVCIVGEPTCRAQLGDIVKIGRRGQLSGSVKVRGRSGHTAYPELADNPVPRLLHFLEQLDMARLDQGSPHFPSSTLTITSIDVGNPVTNMIPATASASFDIRYNDHHTRQSLEAWLRSLASAHLGPHHVLELCGTGDAFITTPCALTETVCAAVTEHTGLYPRLDTSGGTSDARFIRRYCPVVEFGLVGATMHQADERASLADMSLLTCIYHSVLDRMVAAEAH